ncbi:hypothetical protein KCP70_09030 [Salmonella enterica subsp. enterica]|nr:hypothetical protein KCP70_09030 [Salmonella enterica subsp. enterica]
MYTILSPLSSVINTTTCVARPSCRHGGRADQLWNIFNSGIAGRYPICFFAVPPSASVSPLLPHSAFHFLFIYRQALLAVSLL